MTSGAAQIQSLSAQLESLLSETRSKVQKTASSYKGQTSDAWQAKQSSWDATSTDMQQLLQDIGKHVDSSNDVYTSTDAAGSGSAWAVPCRTVTCGSREVRRTATAARSGCGSTPTTDRASVAHRGRWKPVPHPTSRTSRPAHVHTSRIAASITPSGSTARFSSS